MRPDPIDASLEIDEAERYVMMLEAKLEEEEKGKLARTHRNLVNLMRMKGRRKERE